MKRFLLKLTLYGTLSLLLVNSIGWIGDSILRKSSFFKPSFLLNNFKAEEKFDYFILGSSRGLTTLNSKYIDEQLDLNGINLSMDDTDLKSHVLMLKHFFNNGYKSDYCILTLDRTNFIKTQERLGDNDYKFSPFISNNYIQEHYKSYETLPLKPNYNSRLFPFFKYSYYNLQFVPASLIALTFPEKRHRFDDRGNYSYPKTQLTKRDNHKYQIIESNIVNPLINDIKAICKQNNSTLIIYIAPYKNLSITLNDSTNIINHSGLTDSQDYFYDHHHVNDKGRDYANKNFVREAKGLLTKQKLITD